MKKQLIALAAMATVQAASAQSSVTLGGMLKEGVASTSYSNGAPLPGGTVNGRNTALIDSASRVIISGTEDLGGGSAAYFQVDTRFRMDDNSYGGNPQGGIFATGNTFVGLRGGWGAFQAGKMDTHYCTSVNDDISGNGTAVALAASSCALQGYVNGSTAGRSIAVTSRTQNALRYVSPNLSGFSGQVTYSFNPYGGERAVNSTAPRGGATQLGLNYDQGPLAVRFSHWRHSATGAAAATTAANTGGTDTSASQRAWTVGAGYDFGMAKVGLTYDRSQLRDLTAITAAGAVGTATRNLWIVPVTVPLGTGAVVASYARAGDVKLGTGGTQAGTGASHLSVGYTYPLSKRTSLGASYTMLNNGAAGQYVLYTHGGSFGNALAAVPTGTDQRMLYVGMRHLF